MKISELQELLEKAKEEYGDLDVKYCGYYGVKSIECVELVDEQQPQLGIEIY